MNELWALPLLLLMQTRLSGVSPRPVAWAAQSPRPLVCQGAPTLWEVAQKATQARRCRELSRAQAELLRAPNSARERAQRLMAQAPELREARVVHARASLRTGDTATALRELAPLLTDDAFGLTDPGALLDGGRAAIAERDMATAARFYRALGSRAALLPERREQVVAYLEIAAALLVSQEVPIDDVLAYLREARRRASGSGLGGLCGGLTAVAWLSVGRVAEAQGALADVSEPEALERFKTRQDVWLPDGLWHAIMGVTLERTSPEASAEHFQALAASSLAATSVGRLSERAKVFTKAGKRTAP